MANPNMANPMAPETRRADFFLGETPPLSEDDELVSDKEKDDDSFIELEEAIGIFCGSPCCGDNVDDDLSNNPMIVAKKDEWERRC